MRSMVAAAVLASVFFPRLLAAQTSADRAEPKRFSLEAAAGPLVQGGNVMSASFGFALSDGVTFVVGGERSHTPTRISRSDRGFGATRGGTWEIVSAELRLAPRLNRRWAPYATLGLGLGVSHPNVNTYFSDRVSNVVRMAFVGGGASVRLSQHVSAFADARFALGTERDVLFGSLPVRAGVAWHF